MQGARSALLAAALIAAPAAGCGAAAPRTVEAASSEALVDGRGLPVSESDLVARLAASDVALIGEIHDHPGALQLQVRLFSGVLARAPRAALALEFFERDEQPALDAWVAGEIDDAGLAARRRHGARFPDDHHALLLLARQRSIPVIAANAPRRHARMARAGWDGLRELPPDERALSVIPDPLPGGSYPARFASAMFGPVHGGAHPWDERMQGFFRAQSLWDATMADSIARALDRGRGPIFAVAGRFHVERDGGLLQLLKRARPAARITTVVAVEVAGDDDPGLADVVARVGPAPRSRAGR